MNGINTSDLHARDSVPVWAALDPHMQILDLFQVKLDVVCSSFRSVVNDGVPACAAFFNASFIVSSIDVTTKMERSSRHASEYHHRRPSAHNSRTAPGGELRPQTANRAGGPQVLGAIPGRLRADLIEPI
jgi:hypothetical protein